MLSERLPFVRRLRFRRFELAAYGFGDPSSRRFVESFQLVPQQTHHQGGKQDQKRPAGTSASYQEVAVGQEVQAAIFAQPSTHARVEDERCGEVGHEQHHEGNDDRNNETIFSVTLAVHLDGDHHSNEVQGGEQNDRSDQGNDTRQSRKQHFR